MKNSLTLAIVTRKRPAKLKRCLESVVQQKVAPDKVLIIDNDAQKSAQVIYRQFKNKLPLKYLVEPRKGTPRARNKALKFCQTELLGFVDDDCVLKREWVEVAKKTIIPKKTAFVLGKSLLQNPENIFSRAQYQLYTDWFYFQVNKKTNKVAPEGLDSKNVVFLTGLLKKNKIAFDTRFGISAVSGFEDIDLGLQLSKKNLRGAFEPKMIVYHEEVDNFKGMMKKAYERGRLQFLLCHKWKDFSSAKDYFDLRAYRRPDYLYKLIGTMYGIGKKSVRVLFDRNRSKKKDGWEELRLLFLIELYERSFSQGFFAKRDEVKNKKN